MKVITYKIQDFTFMLNSIEFKYSIHYVERNYQLCKFLDDLYEKIMHFVSMIPHCFLLCS